MIFRTQCSSKICFDNWHNPRMLGKPDKWKVTHNMYYILFRTPLAPLAPAPTLTRPLRQLTSPPTLLGSHRKTLQQPGPCSQVPTRLLVYYCLLVCNFLKRPSLPRSQEEFSELCETKRWWAWSLRCGPWSQLFLSSALSSSTSVSSL